MSSVPRVSRAWFVWLYFLEGAPIGWVWWVLPVVLTQKGTPVEQVTLLTSLLTLPWAFKFLWAPFVDRFAHRIGYRPWIWGGLIGMGICLLIGGTTLNWAWLVAYSLCAATQDAAIDGFAMATVPESERGRLNGAMQLGMILGRWLFGSGMLLASRWLDFESQRSLLVGLVAFSALVMVWLPDYRPPRAAPPVGQWLKALPRHFFLLAALGIALLSGLGFEAMGAVVGPFLLELGFTSPAVGGFYSVSLVAMAAGALGGGWLADRVGHRRVFRAAVVGIWGLTVAVALVSRAEAPNAHLSYGLLVAAYAGMGVFMTASYAFFMDLSDSTAYRATTFSALMGSTNACESIAAFGIGRLIPLAGFGGAMAMMGTLSLGALLLFPLASRRNPA